MIICVSMKTCYFIVNVLQFVRDRDNWPGRLLVAALQYFIKFLFYFTLVKKCSFWDLDIAHGHVVQPYCGCMNSYLFYVTGTAHSLLHVLLIWQKHITYAVHQLLYLWGQALGCGLLQDFPNQLLCVVVALVVHHWGGPGPAGHPTIVGTSSHHDLALGMSSQCGLRCLGGRICGLRKGSDGGVAAALYYITVEEDWIWRHVAIYILCTEQSCSESSSKK